MQCDAMRYSSCSPRNKGQVTDDAHICSSCLTSLPCRAFLVFIMLCFVFKDHTFVHETGTFRSSERTYRGSSLHVEAAMANSSELLSDSVTQVPNQAILSKAPSPRRCRYCFDFVLDACSNQVMHFVAASTISRRFSCHFNVLCCRSFILFVNHSPYCFVGRSAWPL